MVSIWSIEIVVVEILDRHSLRLLREIAIILKAELTLRPEEC